MTLIDSSFQDPLAHLCEAGRREGVNTVLFALLLLNATQVVVSKRAKG